MMSNNKDHSKKLTPTSEDKVQVDALGKYANAPYFLEKDKKAKEFLKKHPIPAKFLK